MLPEALEKDCRKKLTKIVIETKEFCRSVEAGEILFKIICSESEIFHLVKAFNHECLSAFTEHKDAKSLMLRKCKDRICAELGELKPIMKSLEATKKRILKECAGLKSLIRGAKLSGEKLLLPVMGCHTLGDVFENVSGMEQQIENQYLLCNYRISEIHDDLMGTESQAWSDMKNIKAVLEELEDCIAT